MKRRKAYPRVVLEDRFTRVVFHAHDDISIEQSSYDALGDRIWIRSDIKLEAPPPWFTKKLLHRLLTISRQRSRRRRKAR